MPGERAVQRRDAGQLNAVADAPLPEVVVGQEAELRRRGRALDRHIDDVHDEPAGGEPLQCPVQGDGALGHAEGEAALQPPGASQPVGLLGQQPCARGDHEHVVAQRCPVIEVHPVGFDVSTVDPGLAEGDAGAELLAPRADDPLHASEPERDEQQSRLVHVISVVVHHDDLSGLLVIGAAQPVGGQRSAGAAAQDHDSLHMIILRLGCWLAGGAFVLRPGDHQRRAGQVPPG